MVGDSSLALTWPQVVRRGSLRSRSLSAPSDPLVGQHRKHVNVVASILPNAMSAKRSLAGEPCATCDRGGGSILRHDRQEYASCSKLEQPARHQRDGASCETSPSRTGSQPVTELRHIRARPVVDAAHP